jgi:hypothetical protein
MTRSEAFTAISELVFDTCRPADCETPNDRIILVRGRSRALVIVPHAPGAVIQRALHNRIRAAGGMVFVVRSEAEAALVLAQHYRARDVIGGGLLATVSSLETVRGMMPSEE